MIVLSQAEIQEITGRVWMRAQASVLAEMGIPYRLGGGRVIVDREAYNAAMRPGVPAAPRPQVRLP
jgi:hypothetical protein